MEATPDCSASVHRPPCGKAEQLLGYAPVELLRFSKWTACKMLVTPHGCFLNLFYNICKAPKLSKVGAQHWILFDLCYITSKGRTNVALRLMVLRLFIPIEDVTQCVNICLDHAVQNLLYLTAHFFHFWLSHFNASLQYSLL